MRPLLVLFTGTTVPNVRDEFADPPKAGRENGEFADFDSHFRTTVGTAWPGPWALADAHDLDTPLPSHASVAGVLVTGSASSVTERTAWMLRLEAWLREAVAVQTPLLGVCFGHQLLATAMGGTVTKNPQGRRLGTVTVHQLDDDALFDGVPRSFAINVSHQDAVVVVPPGARVLVRADHDPHHALAFGDRVRSVQFHPEFGKDIVLGYLRARAEALHAEGLDAEAEMERAIEPPYRRRILQNFVERFVLAVQR